MILDRGAEVGAGRGKPRASGDDPVDLPLILRESV